MNLVVTHAFGDYQVGNQISDEQTVAEILASEQAQFVVKVASSAPESPFAPAKSK
ncbi:hypothetical protein [Herbaspirillum sp. YR522]|uniref:hypothetical protein n=1 Tax=Herbaspirillum sp. YR522 TaxID=1144342 RepID=UPI00026FB349|nr:hypothetical protein [Herbaspirillum sp. YR522]EJN07790.1 hypothetical protein PMI40_01686 [Herbaspirillum sp. YR522]